MENSFNIEIYTDSENQQRIKYQESERKINDQKFDQKRLVDGIYPNEWFRKGYYSAFGVSVPGNFNVISFPGYTFNLTEIGFKEILKI